MGLSIIQGYEGVVRLDETAYGVEQRRDIASMLQYIPRGAEVLDVGCGFGLPTADAAKFFRMSACDLNSRGHSEFIEMLMRLRGIPFKWSEPDKLPFDDASFDALLLYAVIEHVPEKVPLLKECARVLRPHGKIFMFRAVNRFAFAEKLATWMKLVTREDEVVTRRTLEEAITGGGFTIDKIGWQGWLPENYLPKWPIFLANQILTRIPLVNRFSHDYYVVATKRMIV
ncbi:MAG: class I SAM-dependent methyltransferase [Kiritimatiellaeota bacterium]|nr:class I SAM-dependent methyltransferase [Kiritimatiellota bacterium]